MDASGSDTSDSGPLHAARPPRTNSDATKLARQRHRPWADGLAQEKQKAVAKAKKEADLELMTKSRLKVVCRVRPQMRHERDEPPGVACERQVGPWISVEPENERLEFTTAVLGPESTQRHCFVECAVPLLEACLGGQHSSLFAYGETGSGKTFSMLGAEGGRCPSKLDGIVPQLCAELFRRFASQTRQGEREYQIHATCEWLASLTSLQPLPQPNPVHASADACACPCTDVEIFAHRVYDLLAEAPPNAVKGKDGRSTANPELALKETSDGDFLVVGETKERIYSSAGLTSLIEKATSRRATSVNCVSRMPYTCETRHRQSAHNPRAVPLVAQMHEHSSRSHAFLTLHLERRTKENGAEQRQTTRFHLVDLAGSENFQSGQDSGINGGLLALGKVLMALASNKPAPHIPYRDATLTKMLKHVLAGNCLNMMLACINPVRKCVSESKNTLRYAQKASCIINQTRTQSFEEMLNDDPLRDDCFDDDEDMNCRVETIQTANHGDIHARVAGDPNEPLVLYLHGAGAGAHGGMWNDLVRALAARLKETKRDIAEAALSPTGKRPGAPTANGEVSTAAPPSAAPAMADATWASKRDVPPSAARARPLSATAAAPSAAGPVSFPPRKPNAQSQRSNSAGPQRAPRPTSEPARKATASTTSAPGSKPARSASTGAARPTKRTSRESSASPPPPSTPEATDVALQADALAARLEKTSLTPSRRRPGTNRSTSDTATHRSAATAPAAAAPAAAPEAAAAPDSAPAALAPAAAAPAAAPSKAAPAALRNGRPPASRAKAAATSALSGNSRQAALAASGSSTSSGAGKSLFGGSEDSAAGKGGPSLLDLQASLSSKLVSRQLQLVEKECQLCGSILQSCHRLLPCRHSMCGVCWEAGGRYWASCGQCGADVGEGGGLDRHHNEVMAGRMAAPAVRQDADVTRVVTAWQKRFEAGTRERSTTVRLVFEYGADGGRVFLRPAQDGENGMHRGMMCSSALAAMKTWAHFVAEVSFNPNPGHAPPPEGMFTVPAPGKDDGTGASDAAGMDFSFEKTSSPRYAITIKWRGAMAPLEVRYRLGGGTDEVSRIVVQLPPNLTSGGGAKKVGDPVPYPQEPEGEEDIRKSQQWGSTGEDGWVVYAQAGKPKVSSGKQKMRAFGRQAEAKEEKASGKAVRDIKASATGSVVAIQRHLELQASHQIELEEVAATFDPSTLPSSPDRKRDATDGDDSSPQQERERRIKARGEMADVIGDSLLKSCAEAEEHCEVRKAYEALRSLFKQYPKMAAAMQKGPQEQKGKISVVDSEALAREAAKQAEASCPENFFHVAIDLPGYGNSAGAAKTIRNAPLPLIEDVVTALAKSHAYALVGCSQGATGILQAVKQQPGLSNFVVVRTPYAASGHPTQFSGLLNPTLVFADSSGAKDVAEGARGLAGAMQRAVFVEGKGRYMYSEQLSTEMLKLFADHGFRGHLNDLGHNAKAPLLTKLRGGLRSWQGEL